MSARQNSQDYYCILGVPFSATLEEITKAYRELALKQHPDKNPKKDVTAVFQLINQAYEVLRDPAQRKHYNLYDYPGPKGREPKTKGNSGFEGSAQKAPEKFASAQAYHSTQPYPHSSEQAPTPNLDSRIYHLGNGTFFHLTKPMIKKGIIQALAQKSEEDDLAEDMAERYSQLFTNSVNLVEKSGHQESVCETERCLRNFPQWLALIEATVEAKAWRAEQCFRTAFPEFLHMDGKSPAGWKLLWTAFVGEYLPLAKEAGLKK